MQQARKLRRGDKVAIVSLSSGMLGEEYCSHNIEIGVRRLREYWLEPVFMPFWTCHASLCLAVWSHGKSGYGEESYHFFIKQLTDNVRISRI